MKRYISLDENNKVVGIRYGSSIVDGEIESIKGEIGQIRQTDGSFITPPVEAMPMQLTLEEQIAELKQQNLVLMDAIATMYEDLVLGGEISG